jgi:hypothetical protein
VKKYALLRNQTLCTKGYDTEQEAIDSVKKTAKQGDKYLLVSFIRDVEFELVEKKKEEEPPKQRGKLTFDMVDWWY